MERNAPKAGLRTLPTITASEIEASICRLGLGCALRPMPSIHGKPLIAKFFERPALIAGHRSAQPSLQADTTKSKLLLLALP